MTDQPFAYSVTAHPYDGSWKETHRFEITVLGTGERFTDAREDWAQFVLVDMAELQPTDARDIIAAAKAVGTLAF